MALALVTGPSGGVRQALGYNMLTRLWAVECIMRISTIRIVPKDFCAIPVYVDQPNKQNVDGSDIGNAEFVSRRISIEFVRGHGNESVLE